MTDTTAIRDKLHTWASDKSDQIQHAAKVVEWKLQLLEEQDDPALRATLAADMAFIREQSGQ